jgi:hypothetical protein
MRPHLLALLRVSIQKGAWYRCLQAQLLRRLREEDHLTHISKRKKKVSVWEKLSKVYTTLQVYFENKSLKGDFIPMKGNN